MDQAGPPSEQAQAPGELVLTVAFRDDLARHEAELREVWGDPLCVVQSNRTARELRALQDELTSGGVNDLGLEVLWSSTSQRQQVVELDVVAASVEKLAAVERRYGSDVVRVVPALTPDD